MAAPIAQVLQDARMLSRQGRHSDAIQLLEQRREQDQDDLELVFEIAAIHSTQGYINRALDLLDGHDVPNNMLGDMLLILKYCLKPLKSGGFSKSLAEAELISRKYVLDEYDGNEWMRVVGIIFPTSFFTDLSRLQSDGTTTRSF